MVLRKNQPVDIFYIVFLLDVVDAIGFLSKSTHMAAAAANQCALEERIQRFGSGSPRMLPCMSPPSMENKIVR